MLRKTFLIALVTAGLAGTPAASARTNADEAVELYSELMKFKGDRSFHEVGFGNCCKYSEWLKRVDALSRAFTANDISKLQFTPGDLKQLGLEYIKTQGEENKYTNYINNVIKARENRDTAAKTGERIVATTDQACPSLDIVTDFHRALAEGQYRESSRIISHCPTIMKNTVVKGPFKRSIMPLSDGSQAHYLLFSTPDGNQVWIDETNLTDPSSTSEQQ